ncbi:MAG TPA: GxxExxY protein, partial [Cyclobacteriaceae bacterium]|nr:GxxExxY protein [Cyclobacteriaceae bacterium]
MAERKKTKEELEKIASMVVDACYHVHKEMGPGLLESIYKLCLAKELRLRGLKVQTEVFVPLFYKGYELEKDFRMDLLVEEEIILEVKAVEVVHPVWQFQV